MLWLPNDGRYPALDLEPQQRRQKTLEALTAQMEASRRHEARGKRQGPHRCVRAQRGYAVNGVRRHADPIAGFDLTLLAPWR
jgi:hypothetical protein